MLSQTISHYRIAHHLGTSLVGEVYLAEDQQLGRRVALTLLFEEFTRDRRRMARLLEESRALSALNHPNIRTIYEIGRAPADDQPYIVTEFVEGPTLREHLAGARMRLEEVLEAAVQLATGLAAAHAAGVLHRDLRPENIMLRPDGYVKILDFGLAKLLEQESLVIALDAPLSEESAATSDLTESDRVTAALDESEAAAQAGGPAQELGSSGVEEFGSLLVQKPLAASTPQRAADDYRTRPLDARDVVAARIASREQAGRLWWVHEATGYLSPEQMLGEPLDARCDLFSLGVVLHEMCTGRAPFPQKNADELLRAMNDGVAPLARLLPGAPDELDWIVAKAVAVAREERYQTAREMLGDLRRLKQRLEFEREEQRTRARDLSATPEPRADTGGRRAFATAPIAPHEALRESGRGGRQTGGLPVASSGRSGGHASDPLSASGRGQASGATSSPIDSIAVLPMVALGGDETMALLGDGVTESLINALSRLPRVRVMARSTVFRYQGRPTDPLAVGRELGVRAVFTGRLIVRGEQLVLKAELVDAEDGTLLWAEQYAQPVGDLLALESELVGRISEHLKVKLSAEEQRGLAKRYTVDAEAYELYLRGRHFWNQRSLEALQRAIEYFLEAIRRDERYALAYAGLADCYLLLSVYSLPPREFVPKARRAVARALAYDPQLAEAHASQGLLSFWYDWDFESAARALQRAVELQPSHPDPHQWLAYIDAAHGRFAQAFERMAVAQSLDPLSLAIRANKGELLYRARRFHDSIAECEKALEVDPSFAKALYWRTKSQIAAGEWREAIAFLELLAAAPGDAQGLALMLLAVAYGRAGQTAQATALINRLRAQAAQSYFPPYYFAMMTAALGAQSPEYARVFDWLEQAYQERSGWLVWLAHEPLFNGLHADARFRHLLRRIGL